MMQAIIDIVIPVFCLIGLGYGVARSGYMSEAASDGLADFVVKIAVPLLLAKSIATADYGAVNPWPFLAVYFIGIGAAWLCAGLLITLVFKRGRRASVIAGVSASFSNLVLLGIPLIERAYGQQGLQVLFFLISFHLPFMMSLSTFLMEYAVRADGVEASELNVKIIVTKLIKNLAVNPIIIGIFAGLIWRFSGFEFSGLPADIVTLLAQTTGPLALFSLGTSLIKYGIRGNIIPAAALAGLSLIVMPGTIYIVGTTLIVLPALWLKVALLAASCPTGVNAYLFATYFKIAEGLATNAIVLALFGSIITIPFWLSLVS